MSWRKTLCARLPEKLAQALCALDSPDAALLEEIRAYAAGPVMLGIAGELRRTELRVEMDELLCALSGQALYSCEAQMAQGYMTLPGGHRAGVCGVMRREDGEYRMSGVSSVCIRVCRKVPGASAAIRPLLLDALGAPRSLLVLGPPGCGKTTVLRDAALYLAHDKGLRVAVADEREELFPSAQGLMLHVMAGVDKVHAMTMLLRSMAPQVIVTDEIGREADVDALLDAARCGVGILASAHAGDLEDARRRPALLRLMQMRAFDSCVLLGRLGAVRAVLDGDGRRMDGEGKRDGQLGCGGDGDDLHQRNRFFALGR